jgi:cell division protein FtsN
VQAGLFSIRENAERKVAQLKAAGFDALIIEE